MTPEELAKYEKARQAHLAAHEDDILAEMERQRVEGPPNFPEGFACACMGGPRCCMFRGEAARRLKEETRP